MRRSVLHIATCLLLALLYAGESAVPCIDACETACAHERNEQMHMGSGHQDVQSAAHDGQRAAHDGQDAPDNAHHCSNCVCPCHIPAVAGQPESVAVPPTPAVRYITFVQIPPSASVDALDHVPLV